MRAPDRTYDLAIMAKGYGNHIRLAIMVGLGVLFLACSADNRQPGDVVRHPNGLEIVAPERFDATRFKDGFLLTPSNGSALRSPVQFGIAYVRDTVRPPDGWKGRTLDGHAVYFIESEYEMGSGGTYYGLRVWKPVHEGAIIVAYWQQSEHTRPDFSEAWAAAASARVVPHR